jgi:hypothetical protein
MTAIATIPANDRRESFVASAGQTVFPFDFPVYAAADLQVLRVRSGTQAVLTLAVDYTVTGAGLQAGGSITLTAPALAADQITILSAQPASRLSAYSPAGDLRADALNADLNRLWIVQQQIADLLTRVLRLAPTDPAMNLDLPPAATRAGRFLGFDGTGAPIAVVGTAGPPTSAFMATMLDDTDAATARATLGVEAPYVDLASAATTSIGATSGQAVRITGTTTITSFDTAGHGVTRKLRFASSLTLTHNATSLILPGEASIVTAAGDRAEAVSLGAGNWIVTQYTPATAAGMRALAGAGLPATSYVSVLSGSWTGVFDLGLADATFFDIMLPANTQSIIGSGFIITNQTGGGVDAGVFDVAVLNASLVEQARHVASNLLSTNGALSNSGLTVGFNSLAVGNSGWRLRFYGRKITNQGPFNVERYDARIMCVTR